MKEMNDAEVLFPYSDEVTVAEPNLPLRRGEGSRLAVCS